MPATRSRTENWRRSLETLHERAGAIEITLPRAFGDGKALSEPGPDAPKDLIWRVRVLSLSESEIVVEEPVVLGRAVELVDGLDLVGIISIGQNRWMFRTRLIGRSTSALNRGGTVSALRIEMPTDVERCQRRNFYRVSTIGLNLPHVDVYPMTDPTSAIAAEAANRAEILRMIDSDVAARIEPIDEAKALLPSVGPSFQATLMNIGGGGAGLLVTPDERGAFEASRVLWLRIGLRPHVPAPLGVTARVRHTHIDSSQRLYAGMSFDFGHNPAHRGFVVEQICRYVAAVQRESVARQVGS